MTSHYVPISATIVGMLTRLFQRATPALLGMVLLCIAQPVAAAPTASTSTYSVIATFVALIATLIVMLGFALYPFLKLLIDPRFFLELMEQQSNGALYQIWDFSRSIVNDIFVLILVVVAVATVVTAKRDIIAQYATNFITAVILVNFSWFFPLVILDLANVTTLAIYQAPAARLGNLMNCSRTVGVEKDGKAKTAACVRPIAICTGDKAKPGNGCVPADGQGNADKSRENKDYYCVVKGNFCIKYEQMGKVTTGEHMLAGLIVNHAQLPDLVRITEDAKNTPPPGAAADEASAFWSLITKSIFAVFVSGMLVLAEAALLVALIVRIPVLWLTIAFMPFMFIGYVIKDQLSSWGIPDPMKIFEHFVKAAFLPAITAVPLSIGFILINVFKNATPPNSVAKGVDLLGQLLPNVGNVWQLLWVIMSVMVIWKGFWAAIAIDEIYTNATAGIKSFGESVAGIVVRLPLNIPLPILPGGGSLLSLKNKVGGVESLFRTGQGLDPRKLGQVLRGDDTGALAPDQQKKVDELFAKAKNGGAGAAATNTMRTQITNNIMTDLSKDPTDAAFKQAAQDINNAMKNDPAFNGFTPEQKAAYFAKLARDMNKTVDAALEQKIIDGLKNNP